MNYFLKKIIITSVLAASLHSIAYGASISIASPENALANRQPITIEVFLNLEDETVSGISGSFSYDADLFSIDTISSENSVVSLWVKQPSLSHDIYLDGRTHVTFEGIFPGGYGGIRSPYYQGVMPGKLFTATLIPKNSGTGNFMVDTIELNTYNSEATPIKVDSSIRQITVPRLTGGALNSTRIPTEVKSNTVSSFVTRDPLVNNNAWYLVTNDEQSKSAIDTIYVAETDDWNAHLVDERLWKKATNQYILSYQKRTKYIHIKMVYSDSTYILTTLPPVENSTSIPLTSRILGCIAVLLFVVYLYAKYFFIPLSKKQQTSE
jgi:hypothetical protein